MLAKSGIVLVEVEQVELEVGHRVLLAVLDADAQPARVGLGDVQRNKRGSETPQGHPANQPAPNNLRLPISEPIFP